MSAPTILFKPDGVQMPRMLRDLADFREWATSDDFPERGRIDWIRGNVEVDMSPEDLNTHGGLKTELSSVLHDLITRTDRGVVYIDRARISSPEGDLSAEPDVVVLLFESLEAGCYRLIPKANGKPGRFIEIEGAPDLVVECVSDSSVGKDRKHLRACYFDAGVREYWLADARKKDLRLEILTRGASDFEEALPDALGFARSPTLGRGVRLVRRPDKLGFQRYRLELGPE